MFHDVTFREAGVDIEKKRFPSALTPADQRFDLLKTLSSTSVYGLPVLLSGVACLALTGADISTIDKHLKETHLNIQKLPKNTPRAVVHFLGGSLPGTAEIHLRILGLFG